MSPPHFTHEDSSRRKHDELPRLLDSALFSRCAHHSYGRTSPLPLCMPPTSCWTLQRQDHCHYTACSLIHHGIEVPWGSGGCSFSGKERHCWATSHCLLCLCSPQAGRTLSASLNGQACAFRRLLSFTLQFHTLSRWTSCIMDHH